MFHRLSFHIQVQSPEPSTQDCSPGPTLLNTLLVQVECPSPGTATPLGFANAILSLECCSLRSPLSRVQPFSDQQLSPGEPWCFTLAPCHPHLCHVTWGIISNCPQLSLLQLSLYSQPLAQRLVPSRNSVSARFRHDSQTPGEKPLNAWRGQHTGTGYTSSLPSHLTLCRRRAPHREERDTPGTGSQAVRVYSLLLGHTTSAPECVSGWAGKGTAHVSSFQTWEPASA